MVVDALDVVLVDAIAGSLGQPGEFGPFYAQIDKWLDIWYLGLELVVVQRWTGDPAGSAPRTCSCGGWSA